MLDTTKPQRYNAYDRPHDDMREFIARAEEQGELLRIPGADWDLEMGTLGEIVNHARPEPPALLFEDVPGYPKGMRLLSGATNSSKRLAITMGLPVPEKPLDVKIVAATATPIAPPTCWVVFISPDASPACCCGTPMNAAIVTGTKPNTIPTENVR